MYTAPLHVDGGQRGKGVPVIGDNVFIGNGTKIIVNVFSDLS